MMHSETITFVSPPKPALSLWGIKTPYGGGPKNDDELLKLEQKIKHWILSNAIGMSSLEIPYDLKRFIGDTGNRGGVRVICDTRNNPLSDLDQGRVKIDVIVALPFYFSGYKYIR